MLPKEKYNKLTFISNADKQYYGLFQCDCGKMHVARTSHVKTGHIKSCGCYSKDMLRNRAKLHNEMKYPIGFRKGRLTLLEYVIDKSKTSRDVTKGKFKCDCGGECTCRLWQVEQGAISSCGCLQSETAKENIKKATAAKTANIIHNDELATNHIIQSYLTLYSR